MMSNQEHNLIHQYLLPNKKLNHTLLWAELSRMHGFRAEVNRGKRYNEIMEAYESYKNDSTQGPEHNAIMGTVGSGLSVDIPMDTNPQEVKSSIKTPLTGQGVCDALNKHTDTQFKLTGEQYSSYDASEPRYIAEVKVRHKLYATPMIEYAKWNKNTELSIKESKDFLYIVAVSPSLYVFNITTLNKKEWNYGWGTMMLPKNTDFGGQSDKIDKRVGFLNVSEAKIVPCLL